VSAVSPAGSAVVDVTVTDRGRTSLTVRRISSLICSPPSKARLPNGFGATPTDRAIHVGVGSLPYRHHEDSQDRVPARAFWDTWVAVPVTLPCRGG
jgi:hypothetical protein